jgi:hypothetical protein
MPTLKLHSKKETYGPQNKTNAHHTKGKTIGMKMSKAALRNTIGIPIPSKQSKILLVI